ncbi:AAA family ATPase [Campylobacter sp. Cr9]|uniref:DEAD/DEAH box helicase n=1 Tax=Campylobacter sp. Cr9 TaxID=2735728 RepID=UPI0030155209|nr:AAA family ATPase [Campylobacter sp. Cr9]
MSSLFGYETKEILENDKLLLSKNSKDFYVYRLKKDLNNLYISALAYRLCSIEDENIIKCEFYEDKNYYYFITDVYQEFELLTNTSLCFADSYNQKCLLNIKNLIKLLDSFIKLEKLELNDCLADKLYIKDNKLYLDFLCNKLLNNNIYQNNLEVFKSIAKNYFSINLDMFNDFDELKEELLKYIKEPSSLFEINFSIDVISGYVDFMQKQDKYLLHHQAKENLEKYINNHKPYFLLDYDKQSREEIKIALGDFVFCCSTKNDNYLYCFHIMFDNNARLDEIYKKGLYKENISFVISEDEYFSGLKVNKLNNLYEELRHFKTSSKISSSVKSVKMEEDLLRAENEFIQSKKLSQIGIIDSFKDNQICFLIEDFKKHFKQNHRVIIKQAKTTLNDVEVQGVVEKFVSSKGLLYVNLNDEYSGIKLKQYDKYKDFIKYNISYDYQAEESVYKKKERALFELKNSNVYINNLANKLCDPNESFTQNTVVNLERFFNNDLDENQQLAVKKALSLQDGSEILLIQGPPGTGKTTTIVEIIRQFLKIHPNYKMLISSQSNQAVDNVLEKIVKREKKVLRIGNDLSKMSEIARKFTPDKLINTLVSKNLKQLNKNQIQEYEDFQANFKETLQSITSKSAKDSATEMFFIKNVKLIFGTLIGISSWNNFREIVFDLVIVDEAGRATLSELLVPCIKAKRIIFVGDHKQLAPIIDDEIANNLEEYSKAEVVTSLFEQIYESNTKFPNLKHRLTYNYRAHESICNLYSNVFYEGELKTKEELNELKQHNIPFYDKNAIWLNTSRLANKTDEQKGTGKINRCNAKVINKELQKMLEHCKINALSIGIITPYKDQKHLLDSALSKIVKQYKDEKLEIDIGTVDSFQGSDRDIIIYDCVRSGAGNKAKIDFIADEKRLNVSLSRSKKLLLIVGDIEFLYKSSTNKGINPFKEIIEYMQNNQDCYEIKTLGDSDEN